MANSLDFKSDTKSEPRYKLFTYGCSSDWHLIAWYFSCINSACWIIFSNICFFQNFQKSHCFHPFFLLIYNLNVKQFGSQMKPHILWGFIWIQIVCKGHQRSPKFTASGLRVKTDWEKKCSFQRALRDYLSDKRIKWL